MSAMMQSVFSFFFCTLLIIGCSPITGGVHITSVRFPPVVLSGDPVSLSCHYSLQGESLYSLTWWKDDKPFYKYVPALVPPRKNFNVPGIEVDMASSDLNEVVLSSVDHRASGQIRCEVVSERSFEKDTKAENMTVIVKSHRAPRITGRLSGYRIGDLLALNCTSGPSHPKAKLSWYINGAQAYNQTIIIYPPLTDKYGLISSTSGLQMFLKQHHFVNGGVVIGCSASILHIEGQISEVIIIDSDYPVEAPKSQFSEGRSAGLSIRGPERCLHLLLLLVMLSWRVQT